ncbi:hypothetical protein HK414_19615 [Ramlibacter terrae]|uniref:Uncharacterized protein n=1 Tax=Ramlibacter terrae TaxID=2732511 RepID=A0ABX6P6H7_9BURK|nr:hypothetical protein HK414_19615 [Ramlibacter terrae]
MPAERCYAARQRDPRRTPCPCAAAGAQPVQHPHAHHGGLYERLHAPGRIDRPEQAAVQNVFDSPAPKAARMGRWSPRAPLPLPRSEMAGPWP